MPDLPPDVGATTVHGRLADIIQQFGSDVNLETVTHRGKVYFDPRIPYITHGPSSTVYTLRTIEVAFDDNGEFTTELVPTDSPVLSDVDWTYRVYFRIGGARIAEFDMAAPDGASIELANVIPIASSTGTPVSQGPPGPPGPAGADSTVPGPPGPAGADGAQGPAGADGPSAYEVAVAEGFVGTEADWLASLVGPQGPQGIQGPAGADGADGATGPAGADGAPGPAGPAGADGADGPSAYEVAIANGFVGTEAAWLASLVGPEGPAGPAGADGATGPAGPAGADGADGIGVPDPSAQPDDKWLKTQGGALVYTDAPAGGTGNVLLETADTLPGTLDVDTLYVVRETPGAVNALDTFTRADTTGPLGTSDSGHSWVSSGMGISSGQAYMSGGYGVAAMETGASDGVLTAHFGSGSIAVVGLVFRYVDASNYYVWRIAQGSTWGFSNDLYRYVGGTGTLVASGVGPASGVVPSVELDGPNMTLKFGSTVIGTYSSTTFQTATKHGIAILEAPGRWEDVSFVKPTAPVPAVITMADLVLEGDPRLTDTRLPAGGTAGQTLVKQSVTDGDALWGDFPDGKFRGEWTAEETLFSPDLSGSAPPSSLTGGDATWSCAASAYPGITGARALRSVSTSGTHEISFTVPANGTKFYFSTVIVGGGAGSTSGVKRNGSYVYGPAWVPAGTTQGPITVAEGDVITFSVGNTYGPTTIDYGNIVVTGTPAPYNTGDVVVHNGRLYKSNSDGNGDTPGVSGWTEIPLTVDAADISDATAVGEALITAADEAAARTAIDAVGSASITTILPINRTAYDALGTPDPATMYLIDETNSLP